MDLLSRRIYFSLPSLHLTENGNRCDFSGKGELSLSIVQTQKINPALKRGHYIRQERKTKEQDNCSKSELKYAKQTDLLGM